MVLHIFLYIYVYVVQGDPYYSLNFVLFLVRKYIKDGVFFEMYNVHTIFSCSFDIFIRIYSYYKNKSGFFSRLNYRNRFFGFILSREKRKSKQGVWVTIALHYYD